MSETPLLDRIQGPKDVKQFTPEELETLAKEIRQRLIEVISQTGGHLASNLGIVELTIALHYVFDSPADKFIFDVSHQSYIHKLLTGRNDRFPTVRQYQGLCGFTHPAESEHDHFCAGHAGTALSLALGVAKTRDLNDGDEYVIPILGDASLSCGLTLEAMNNLSRQQKRFIMVVNDNEMSISAPVGNVQNVLSRLISNPTMNKVFQEIDHLVSKVPYGEQLANQGKKVTESIKNLVSPAIFFEHFGFSYIGPVDGHNLQDLIRLFEGVRDSQWPIVIHALTTKGQGMDVAEENPTTWHGAKPFNPDTYKVITSASPKPTYPKIFGKTLLEMAKDDPSIVAVTPAMSAGSCLDGMMKEYPERCIDVGIAEGHAVTYAGGLAKGGKSKVFMSIYGTFLQRALDNVYHDVCIQDLPVVFAIDRGGLSGPDGRTHHGIFDIGFLKMMPNMIISQPRNGQVLRELMHSSFAWGQPAAIRYPNMATEEGEGPLKTREPGKGEVLAEGKDILLIALGHHNDTALKARELMIEQGLEPPTVLDPVFVKPLDSELICSLLMTHHKIVTIEEHSLVGGLGNSVNHFLLSQGFHDVPVLNLGIPDTFIDHGSHGDLMKMLGLTPEGVVKSIVQRFSLKPQEAATV